MTEFEERAAVVAEAESWLGTPYESNACVKGEGVDCIMFVVGVFSNVGLIPFEDPRPYPAQWAIHQRAELMLEGILRHSHEIEGPPGVGDVMTFQFGNCWSHAAIVVRWPEIIHANPTINSRSVCRRDNVEANYQLKYHRGVVRAHRYFSVWPR